MENTVAQRLNLLVDTFEKGIKSSFANRIGISQQGAHDLLNSRKGGPSFTVLTKVLEGYPQIRIEWLVLGKGPMLQEEATSAASEAPEHVTKAQLQEIEDATRKKLLSIDKAITEQRQLFEAYKHDLSEKAQLEQVYRIVGIPQYDMMLADRLNVTPEEARDLVLSGRIRSTYAGKDNDRARRNGVSYLVTEKAVREFLGDIPA